MRRAFVFTVDALFSLVLISSVALMFSVYSTQTEYAAKTTLLQSLAYDFVTLSQPPVSLNASAFKEKTGLDVFTRESDMTRQRQMVAAATRYAYNNSCNAADCGKSCRINRGTAEGYDGYGCLVNQTISRYAIIPVKAWVATP